MTQAHRKIVPVARSEKSETIHDYCQDREYKHLSNAALERLLQVVATKAKELKKENDGSIMFARSAAASGWTTTRNMPLESKYGLFNPANENAFRGAQIYESKKLYEQVRAQLGNNLSFHAYQTRVDDMHSRIVAPLQKQFGTAGPVLLLAAIVRAIKDIQLATQDGTALFHYALEHARRAAIITTRFELLKTDKDVEQLNGLLNRVQKRASKPVEQPEERAPIPRTLTPRRIDLRKGDRHKDILLGARISKEILRGMKKVARERNQPLADIIRESYQRTITEHEAFVSLNTPQREDIAQSGKLHRRVASKAADFG